MDFNEQQIPGDKRESDGVIKPASTMYALISRLIT